MGEYWGKGVGRRTGVSAQQGGDRCDAGVIRAGEGTAQGEGTTRKEGDQWGELPCCDPRPMEGEPSNTHCTVRPSSKRGSGVSILTSASEGPCPPLAF